MKLFTAPLRGKIAAVLVALGVVDVVVVGVLWHAWNLMPFYFAVILVGLLLYIPEFSYLKSDPQKLWKRWSLSEDALPQQRRRSRAENLELTPIRLHLPQKYATFAGSTGGTYVTTLTKCTCPDFQKRHVPCKHMYFLAMQMDLIEEPLAEHCND